VARGLGDGKPLRLMMVDLQGRTHAETLKLDTRYWPTTELKEATGGGGGRAGGEKWEVRQCS